MSDSSTASKLSESKREQILEGAREIFMNKGFAAASMEQIARSAGVSKGTLYNYFENKETLFVALIQGECCKGGSHDSPPSEYSDTPPELILQTIGQQWLTSLLEAHQRALFRIVLAEAMQFPELGQAIEESGPALARRNLAHYLDHLHQRGIVDIADTTLAAEQFFALCDAGVMRKIQLSVCEPTAEMIASQVSSAVKLFLQGYRPQIPA
ncbi:TetR/AcrR family transcriptional regulator [Chitinibacter sp. S2-10]|uniref:TetR/AcrR family transcriptional regulator n=1 Tax=Chitinibacter sp. S2-10 TaxID=3373597 RepID=UPI003977C5F1